MMVKHRKLFVAKEAAAVFVLEAHMMGASSRLQIDDLPGTGRVIFHLEEGRLFMVESFDEGPSRRDVQNVKRPRT